MFKKLFLSFFLILFPSFAYAASTVTVTDLGITQYGNSRPLRAVQWDWVCDGADSASDSTATATLTGKIVGVRAKDPNGDISAAYTVKIKDSAGHDVLQGIGVDTEFSATATVDSEFRVPVDDTSGGYIYLWFEPVYLDISDSADGDSGRIILLIEPAGL